MYRIKSLSIAVVGLLAGFYTLQAPAVQDFVFQLQIADQNINEYSDPVTERPVESPLCLADDPRTRGEFANVLINDGVYYFDQIVPEPLPGFKFQTCSGASSEYFAYDGETIVNQASGECLTLIDESMWLSLIQPITVADGLAEVTRYDAILTDCDGSAEQKWEIDAADQGDAIVLYNKSLGAGQCQIGAFGDGGSMSIESSPLFRTQTFDFVRQFCGTGLYVKGWKHRSNIAQLEQVKADGEDEGQDDINLAWLPAVLHLTL